jgi:hypothetical protein
VRIQLLIAAIASSAVLASAQVPPPEARADRVIVVKKERILTLVSQGNILETDEQMDEIWRVVPDGTPIEIRP